MVRSIQISGKVWLSISILIVGYLFSMIMSVVLGVENVDTLKNTSDVRFPATRHCQVALSAFVSQLQLYQDAATFGEADKVQEARESAKTALGELRQITTLQLQDDKLAKKVKALALELQRFTDEASDAYATYAQGLEVNQDRLRRLDNQKQRLRHDLEWLEEEFSNKLRYGLAAIIEDTKHSQKINFWTFIVAMGLSGIIMQLAIKGWITKPLAQTVAMLEELEKGKLDRRLEIETQDEIGRMARAMDHFADNLTEKVQLAEAIANGDLTVNVSLASEYDTLGEAMNTMVKNLKAHQAAIENNIASLEMQALALKRANESLTSEISERKEAQRELAEAQVQLLDASRQAGMAEVATGVLHNVGNVLNSVNVSTTIVTEKLSQSQALGLSKACDLITQHEDNLATFMTEDKRGQKIPRYLNLLSSQMLKERETLLKEMATLSRNVSHIKEIVKVQQSFAKVSGVAERVVARELIEHAVEINGLALTRNDVAVDYDIEVSGAVMLERQKVLQILINLVKNGVDALAEDDLENPRIALGCKTIGDNLLRITVQDNGIGITRENLTRIFGHGFTTKKSGHGFGLHAAALSAKEMGGRLEAHSEGRGQGACFTLEMPLLWAEDSRD